MDHRLSRSLACSSIHITSCTAAPPHPDHITHTQAIASAPVAALPCYLHVNPRLASVLTLDLECEEEVLGDTARRATDLPSRIWAYEQLIHEAGTPSALRLVR